MALVDQAIMGLKLGGGTFLVLLVGVYAANLIALVAEGRSVRDAVPDAFDRTWALAIGVLGALGLVITQAAAGVDVFAQFLATHTVAATNVFALVLGWLGIQGHISSLTFIVAVGTFAFLAIVAREVRS